MTDVFLVQETASALAQAPIASTSATTIEDGDAAAAAAGPTLAQLLQETVREGARRGSRVSNGKHRSSNASKTEALAPLPSLPTLTTPASRAYISTLLSKDLLGLLREPDELKKQSEALDADLATLCYKSIGDILGVGECVDTVEEGFGRMQSALDSLLDCTELLSSSCTDFTSSINPILKSRTRLNLVRSNIASIEDILSIPRLVSTCIRGGWWTEALDLAFRARDLEDLLQTNSSSFRKGESGSTQSRRNLLGKVREEVEDELEVLRSRIIEGLRGRQLKLPSAVRSISLMRRLSTSVAAADGPSKSLTEAELRLTFLASRWDCLKSQLEQLELSAGSASSADDRLRYLKRWVEVWREVIGDTVTIYSEIFLGFSSGSVSPAASSPLEEYPKPVRSSVDSESTSPLSLTHPAQPLPVFLAQAIKALQDLLSHQLPQLTAVSALASLQTQLTYCSAAFAKFGFDFRHIPNRAIISRIQDLTIERFDLAAAAFRKDLSRALTQSGSRGGRPRLVINALLAVESTDSIAALDEDHLIVRPGSATSHAPSFIALYPPLAKLLNNYAVALNDLRLMPLISLYPALARALQTSLGNVALDTLHFMQVAKGSLQSDTTEDAPPGIEASELILRRFVIALCRCILPWCSSALDEGVYPDLEKEAYKPEDALSSTSRNVKDLLDLFSISTNLETFAEQSTVPEVDTSATGATDINETGSDKSHPVVQAAEFMVEKGTEPPALEDDNEAPVLEQEGINEI